MAWQVAIVVDSETSVGSLIGWLPVWAWTTPQRRESAPELWESWNKAWAPEPALTLIGSPVEGDLVPAVIAEIPTIELHHPELTALRFFGLANAETLHEMLGSLGYKFVSEDGMEGLLYVKPMDSLSDVKILVLEARDWQTSDDVYNSFFDAVCAPTWHGRNFNALNDSIATGAINKIEIPYQIEVRNVRLASRVAQQFVDEFAGLIADLKAKGCPVEMRVER